MEELSPPPLPILKASATKSNWRVIAAVAAIVLIVGASAVVVVPFVQNPHEAASRPTNGLEFVITVEPDGDGNSGDRKQILEDTAEVLRERLRHLGIRFAVDPDADGRLVVKVPLLAQPTRVEIRNVLTRPGLVEFRLVHPIARTRPIFSPRRRKIMRHSPSPPGPVADNVSRGSGSSACQNSPAG